MLKLDDVEDESDLDERLAKAQQNLAKRSKLLDQFEKLSDQLHNLDEGQRKKLSDGTDIQQHYDQLMELDAEMQQSIEAHLKMLEKQSRTNKKERDVDQKYTDQRGGSVDNSLFITSKLEG